MNRNRTGLIAMLLSALGITSCSRPIINSPECMYGCPTATFTIKGNVTDESGNPLKDIRVNIQSTEFDRDEVTDSTGAYTFFTSSNDQVKEAVVYFTDERYPEVFEADSLTLTDIKYSDGKNKWDLGHAEIHDANIALKKK